MDLWDIHEACLSLPAVEDSTPFGPNVTVYKVAGKMFALTTPDDVPPRLNLKCDPERALDLRDQHPSILAGYHMNKRHWNTHLIDGSLPPALLRELIQHSYDLVIAALPKKQRASL